MKTFAYILLCTIFYSTTINAQTKVDALLAKGAVANSQLSNLGVKADSLKSNLGKLTSLFKKKDKAPKEAAKTTEDSKANAAAPTVTTAAVPTNNTTIFTVSGADFSTLQTLNEDIKACSGVQSTTYKFSHDASVITINHTGTTDDIFKLIQETCKSIFTSKNVEGVEEGKINIKL